MHARFESLKAHLLAATDFAPVLAEFFDLAESPRFMELGQPARDLGIEEALRVTALELGGEPEDLLLIRVPEEGFLHGRFSLGPMLGGLFYFEDLQMGLATAVDPTTGEARIARFTTSRPFSGHSAISLN